MNRRNFIGAVAATLLTAAPSMPIAATPVDAGRWRSRAARAGYLPDVPLVTHDGRRVRFYDDLVCERTVLINFFLAGCRDGLCPATTANLRRVQELLGERVGRDIFFYSVTLMPENDTPALLSAYMRTFGVGPGWTFLTGRRADIDLLRRRLGYVDPDPVKDRDPANHTNVARFGNDRLERWGMVSLRSTPKHIASTFRWLSA